MKSNYFFLFLAGLLVFSSCGKDDDPIDMTPEYTIPTTYNFSNIDYSGQTQRIGMLTEMKAYMKSANTSGTVLDANKLVAMYANDAANAGWSGTYEDSKQMRGKTFEPVQATFDALLADLAEASESTVAGVAGAAGVVVSNDGAKNYLFNDKGIELGQVIEKGLMGALLYYQSSGVYFESGKIDSDNETVTEGKGTEMEHAFDEAFGYFGVPTDFPTNTDNLAFWGTYCNGRNAVLGSNQSIMDAFLKGRAAISGKDITTRDEAIAEVRDAWELVIVGTALHYINSGLADFDDVAKRGHGLSEAIGFIYSLQFSPSKKITNAQVEELLTLVGGSASILDVNLYNATEVNLQSAKDKLADWYDLVDNKDEF
ncbi:MAG: DUF4856 domain-containing protein [Saprospiraceae bacterium]